MDQPNDAIWHGDYKIPWHDPDFSRRMLAEHLSQEHDLASRRVEWIDRQVACIHNGLLNSQASRILDLGCGPGFYSHRLAALGHLCRGIDFGPAAIEYARREHPDQSPCEFILADIRSAEFAGPHDLAMILYGELNVFSPHEALTILRRVQTSLAPHGHLIVEVQTPEAVERTGRGETTQQQSESGLFSDRPHCCCTESQWLPEQGVAIQTFHVTEADAQQSHTYRSTTKAWPDGDLIELLQNAGYKKVFRCGEWPSNSDDLVLWIAVKK